MKKLLLILFILLVAGIASADWVIRVVSTPAVCTKDTSNLVMNYDSWAGDAGLDGDVQGQSFSYASPFSLYSASIKFAGVSSLVVTVRMGSSSDLSTYTEEWASVSIPADGFYEFVSAVNSACSASTLYYIGVILVSGTGYWTYGTNEYADGTSMDHGSAWVLGSPGANDRIMKVNKCQ